MIGNMTTSFLLQTGFSQTDIGLIQGGVGLAEDLEESLLKRGHDVRVKAVDLTDGRLTPFSSK